MAEVQTFLAASILNEGSNISYRQLSRHVKTHANVAKKLLYDFHRTENERKPNSVVATYLIDGFLRVEKEQAPTQPKSSTNDVHMASSPFQSSAPQPEEKDSTIPVRQISLVLEQHLEDIRQRYATIDSIHVYSLGPAPLKNLEILSDCNRIVTKQYMTQDPLIHGQTYGVLHNKDVRRRTGKRPPNIVEPLPEPKVTKTPAATQVKTEKAEVEKAKPAAANVSSVTNSSKSTDATRGSTKRTASNIFKAFAAKPKPKLESQDSASSANSASLLADSTANGDVPMDDVSEDEKPEDFITSSKKPSKQEQQSRLEREAALKKMMDDDDAGDEDSKMADAPPPAADSQASTEAEQPADDADPDSEFIDKAPTAPKSASPEPPPPTTSGGRRRGRRKVMKKKTIKDEEGYLVTKEEPAWESFSEDEPAPSLPKKSGFASSSMASAKGKKGKGTGTGDITSFFGKR